MDVFAEHGYHRATIDEIARRSGVTPPVIYDHFASKPALHERLLRRTRDELLEMWRENLHGAGHLQDGGAPLAFAMASEVIRGGLTELAIWWSDHPDVSREQIVQTAMNTVWIGFQRVSAGEVWSA